MHVIGPAAIYFAVVFAAGFALGALRTLVVGPALGQFAAIALEIPVILLVSWYACRWTIVRFVVAGTPGTRLGMGAVAFMLLMAAEFELTSAIAYLAPEAARACNMTSQSVASCFLTGLTAPDRLLGLAAQIVFALLPWIELRVAKGRFPFRG